jgi:hypothetical protein
VESRHFSQIASFIDIEVLAKQQRSSKGSFKIGKLSESLATIQDTHKRKSIHIESPWLTERCGTLGF